jgi:hypothetical protein
MGVASIVVHGGWQNKWPDPRKVAIPRYDETWGGNDVRLPRIQIVLKN